MYRFIQRKNRITAYYILPGCFINVLPSSYHQILDNRMRFLETQLYPKQKYLCYFKEDRTGCENNRKNMF